MKLNVFAGLLTAATLCFFAPNADAQNAVATSGQAPVVQECQECEGGAGVGRVGALSSGALRARVAATRGSVRIKVQKRLYNRDIVDASPYATPSGEPQDWARFRHYPYAYYPHNFNEAGANPAAMQVQKYNPDWQNYYPTPRRFHEGKHFLLDVF